jgi:hypothetical protein
MSSNKRFHQYEEAEDDDYESDVVSEDDEFFEEDYEYCASEDYGSEEEFDDEPKQFNKKPQLKPLQFINIENLHLNKDDDFPKSETLKKELEKDIVNSPDTNLETTPKTWTFKNWNFDALSETQQSVDNSEYPVFDPHSKSKINRNKVENSFLLDTVFALISKPKMSEETVKPIVDKKPRTLCKFFAKNGKCNKMDNCTFLHDASLISKTVPAQQKTSIREPMCKFMFKNGCNRKETCRYKHSLEEIHTCNAEMLGKCNKFFNNLHMCIYRHKDDTFDSYKQRYFNRLSNASNVNK